MSSDLDRLKAAAVAWLRSLRGTSSRTFFAYPLATLLFQALFLRQVRPQPMGLLVMAWGYLQYRLCGAYLMRTGEGSGFGQFSLRRGLSRGERVPTRAPARLVTTGPYALTRNPMYLGHIIFMAGLALTTRSPLALALGVYHTLWLQQRALEDEAHMSGRFGQEYETYRSRVPRWFPPLPND